MKVCFLEIVDGDMYIEASCARWNCYSLLESKGFGSAKVVDGDIYTVASWACPGCCIWLESIEVCSAKAIDRVMGNLNFQFDWLCTAKTPNR
jgi:hypothetical protein